MGQVDGSVSPVGIFHSMRERWRQYVLEAACDTMLTIWTEEKPEYIDDIRHWVETGQIPDDHDLRTLCKVYEERVRPTPCCCHART